MTIATHRDLATTREQLRSWLGDTVPGATDIRVGEVTRPPGAGFSNETLFADALWTEHGEATGARMVIRVEPSTHTLYFQAQQRFRRQVEVLRILGSRTDVPVAHVRFVEDDPGVLGSPFFVMDRVDGDTVPDQPPYNQQGWLHDATAQEQETLWWSTVDELARLHTLEWRALGLDRLLLDVDGGEIGTAQQLGYWDAAHSWAAGDRAYPMLDRTRAWLRTHLPAREHVALCWGDARLANVIYADFRPRAIIDWDLVAIGNPLQDLAWWFLTDEIQFGDRHTGRADDPHGLPGFPSIAETLSRWSATTGCSSENLDYYLALAGYKFAVCAVRYVELMNAAGFPPEAAGYAEAMRVACETILSRVVQ